MAELKMSENELQTAIVQAAKLAGWLVYHTHDSRHSEAGFPDLVLVRNTTAIFAELKSEKGQLTYEQTTWAMALRFAGLDVRVWYPRDLDAVLRELTQRDR